MASRPTHLFLRPTPALLAVVFCALFLTGCSQQATHEQLRSAGVHFLPEPAQVAGFQLQTQTGAPFGAQDLAGNWSYLFFGFTHCPHLCPTTLAVLAEAEPQIKALPEGDKFRALFISVDPARDDAAAIATYLARFSDGFLGLHGDPSETLKIARNVDVAFATLPDGQGGLTVEHSGHIVLIDPDGRYRGFIKAPHRSDTLVSAYRQLTG